jgi:hypothetical protein
MLAISAVLAISFSIKFLLYRRFVFKPAENNSGK